jgi:hypothetical protein
MVENLIAHLLFSCVYCRMYTLFLTCTLVHVRRRMGQHARKLLSEANNEQLLEYASLVCSAFSFAETRKGSMIRTGKWNQLFGISFIMSYLRRNTFACVMYMVFTNDCRIDTTRMATKRFRYSK